MKVAGWIVCLILCAVLRVKGSEVQHQGFNTSAVHPRSSSLEGRNLQEGGEKKLSYHEKKAQIKKWQDICEKYSFSLPSVALQFALLPDVVEQVAIGMSDGDEVEKNAALFGDKIVPVGLWQEAQKEGLLRKEFDFSQL